MKPPASGYSFTSLPPVADAEGFAGPVAGLVDGALVIAGGANFPGKKFWEGGRKCWHDSAHILPGATTAHPGEWRTLEGSLPEAVGYSVCASALGGIVYAGGETPSGPTAAVRLLKVAGNGVSVTDLPSLPHPVTNACGGLVGSRFYVLGGQSDLSGNGALAEAWMLDLANLQKGWVSAGWPQGARARILGVAGVKGSTLYLFGGCDLGSAHWDRREYLTDCWALDTTTGKWTRLADQPREAAASPSPAALGADGSFAILGGVSRSFVERMRTDRPATNGAGHEHPGFENFTLRYDSAANSWTVGGGLPFGDGQGMPVTTPAVPVAGGSIVPSGEGKPGIRTRQVFCVRF